MLLRLRLRAANAGPPGDPLALFEQDTIDISVSVDDYDKLTAAQQTFHFDDPTTPKVWATFALYYAAVSAESWFNKENIFGSPDKAVVIYPANHTTDISKIQNYLWKYTWNNMVKISLAGASVEREPTLRFLVHYGERQGTPTGRDIFVDKLARTDFADVRFMDENWNLLPQWQTATGNYDLIPDEESLTYNVICDENGHLWKSGNDGKLYTSTDNGETWTLKHGAVQGLVCVAKNGTVITMRTVVETGNEIYRSPAGGESPVLALTLPVGSSILRPSSAENALGHLFMAQYQNADDATIYRSTDDGVTWSKVFYVPATGSAESVIGCTAEKGSVQHFHGLAVDPYTDYIYAGSDVDEILWRSIDGGDSWQNIYQDLGADYKGYAFYETHRLFGGESGSRRSIVLTEDDENFQTVVSRGLYPMLATNGDVVVGGSNTAGAGARFPHIMLSEDQGYTWRTIVNQDFEVDEGFSYGLDFGGGRNTFVNPLDGERQLFMGADGDHYIHSRFYQGVTDRYMAEILVKVPVPSTGKEIFCCFGGGPSSQGSFSNVLSGDKGSTGLTSRWKMNEGAGSVLADFVGAHDMTLSGNWSSEPIVDCSRGAVPYRYSQAGAVEFNGDGFATVAAHEDFNSTASFGWIISIEPLDIGAEEEVILCKGDYTQNNGWALTARNLYGDQSEPALRFRYSNGSANTLALPAASLRVGQKFSTGFTVDGSTPPNISFFVNGHLVNTVALDYALIAGDGPIVVGALGDAGKTMKLNARIADVRYYADTVITQDIARSIYEHREIVADDMPAVTNIGLVESSTFNGYERVDYSLVTGATYYVATGYTYNGDGSLPSPAIVAGGPGAFNRVDHAFAASVSGDTIIVMPGTYAGASNMFAPAGKNLYIVSAFGPAQTIIDGTNERRCAYYASAETAASRLDGFTLYRGRATGGGGVYIAGASPTLRNIIVDSCGAVVASSPKGGGISLGVTTSLIENVVLINGFTTGSGGSGGNLYCAAGTEAVLRNISISGGLSDTGADIRDISSTTKYINVISFSASVGNSFSTAPTGDRMTYSNVQKATTVYAGTGNLNADPLFVSATDLRLQVGSPCRNTGAVIAGRTADILGNIVDETPDMGAYEND